MEKDRALRLQEEYIHLKRLAEETDVNLKAKRQEIIDASGGEGFIGRLLSLKKSMRKGGIDYKSLFRFYNIDVATQDTYRAPTTETFTLKINPEPEEG